jgi:hypothetical protein
VLIRSDGLLARAMMIAWLSVQASVRRLPGLRRTAKLVFGRVAKANISALRTSARRACGPDRTFTWPCLTSGAKTVVGGAAAVRPTRTLAHLRVKIPRRTRYRLP